MKWFWLLAMLFPYIVFAQEPRLVFSAKHLDSKENESGINSLSISPDQRFIASGARDGIVKVWDIKTGKLIYDLVASEYSSMAVFSKEGKWLISGGSGKPAAWLVSTGKRQYELPLDPQNSYSITSSETGKFFATTSNASKAYIWETSTGKLIDSAGETETVYFTDLDKRIAYQDKEQIIFRTIGTNTQFRLGTGNDFIQQYNITPDGKTLLILYPNNLIESWDINSKTKKGAFTVNVKDEQHSRVELSAISQQVLVLDPDGEMHLYDSRMGKENATISTRFFGYYPTYTLDPLHEMLVYKEDSSRIAIVKLSKPSEVLIVETDLSYPSFVRFNADNSLFGLASFNDLALVNTSDRSVRPLGLSTYTINKAGIDSAGFTVAASSDNYAAIKVWGFNEGGTIRNFYRKVNGYDHTTLELDKAGTHLLTNALESEDQLDVWDLKNNRRISVADTTVDYDRVLPVTGMILDINRGVVLNYPDYARIYMMDEKRRTEKQSPIYNIISPQQQYAIAEGNRFDAKEPITLIHLKDNRTQVLPQKLKTTSVLRFSFNEKWLVIGSTDGRIDVWDIEQSKVIYNWKVNFKLLDIVFSPDDATLLVHTAKSNDSPLYDYQSEINSYSTSDWKKIRTWNNLGYTPESLLFAHSGRSFYTSEEDNFTDEWQISNGKKLRRLNGSLSMNKNKYHAFGNYILTQTPSMLYIWKPSTMEMVYSLNFIDSADYIARIPTGYFMCPPGVARQLHYVTKELNVVTFEQLDIKYNRPDKVLEAIGSKDTALIRSFRKAYLKRIARLGIDTTSFRQGFSVPQADIANRTAISYEQKQGNLRLRIKGNAQEVLDRMHIWINETPLFGIKGIDLRKSNKKLIDTTINVSLSQGMNSIEASVIDANGTESYRMPLVVNYTPAKPTKEKTWFIGIGMSDFADKQYNLLYSVKDIRDLATQFGKKYGNEILIDTLFNEKVNHASVMALKHRLLQAGENDKVILVYSGHGLLSSELDYYLSTYAVNFDKPEQGGLLYEDIESLLDGIPARKKLMLIDACHSGEVDKEEGQRINAVADSMGLTKGLKPISKKKSQLGLANSFELMQRLFVNVSKNTGTTVISAAAGNQFALERGDLQNGVFTFSILEAMRKYPSMALSDLKSIVTSRVVELTKGLQQPNARNELKSTDWDVW